MIYDKRIMFAMRAAKNLAKATPEEREAAYAQMNKSQYGIISKAVNLLLSKMEKVS